MRTAHRLWVVTAVLLLAACNPVEFDPQVSYPGFEQGLVRYSGPSVAWLDAGVSGTAGHVVYAMALVRNEHLTGPRDRLCIGGGDAIVPCIDTGVDVRQPSQRLLPADGSMGRLLEVSPGEVVDVWLVCIDEATQDLSCPEELRLRVGAVDDGANRVGDLTLDV